MGYFYRRFSGDSLNKIYELLEDATPCRFDCGVLCGAACCKGGDRDGMILFPGERDFFAGKPGFTIRRNYAYGYEYLVCGGTCERDDRPLSCRIYPYFFYVAENSSVVAAPDVRAPGHCPLARRDAALSRLFLRRMRMCAKAIREDPDLYAFVRGLSDAFTDLGPLGSIAREDNGIVK